ncbi:MAG: hypothetical protein C0404_05875 [Verrucomicrobia bacterium]|nr:hypothetical protein [Verrucomicrobiota bacterium]
MSMGFDRCPAAVAALAVLASIAGLTAQERQAPPPDVNLGVQRSLDAATRGGMPAFISARPVRFAISGSFMQTGNNGSGNVGDVSTRRAAYSVGALYMTTNMVITGFTVDRELSNYSFDMAGQPDFRREFTDMSVTRASVYHRRTLNRSWSFFGAADVTSAAGENADRGNSLTGGGLISARSQFTTNFAMVFGLLARTRLDDDLFIMVVPGVEWQVTERLSFRTAQGLTTSYRADSRRRWTADLNLQYESRQYRLADDSTHAGGLAEDRRIPVILGVNYRPNPGIHVHAFAGLLAWQRLDLKDSDGLDEQSIYPDPTPLYGLSLAVRF